MIPAETRIPNESTAGSPRIRDGVMALTFVALGLGFGLAVWLRMGSEYAQQYLAAYLIELSLSVDNVFVFAIVFARFGVDPSRRRRLLFWGIAGAILFRSTLILAGIGAIQHFRWLVAAFGALVLATGVRLAVAARNRRDFDPSAGPVMGRVAAWVSRRAPTALAAFVVLETADLIFALDSLPAVIAVTHDAFIAMASNLFAILGLRSLFFVVSGAMRGLSYLNVGLAAILSLVGVKMLAEPWYRVPTGVSLAAMAAVLAVSVGASILERRRAKPPSG